MIGLDDPNYERWLANLALECSCCDCCWEKPCGGCQAGGVCDAMPCSRDGGEGDDEDDGFCDEEDP